MENVGRNTFSAIIFSMFFLTDHLHGKTNPIASYDILCVFSVQVVEGICFAAPQNQGPVFEPHLVSSGHGLASGYTASATNITQLLKLNKCRNFKTSQS